MLNIRKFNPFRLRSKITNGRTRHYADNVTITTMVIATIALFGLIYYQVRPVELVDIKVPVSTTKSEYKPGDIVQGIFFGEVFYQGRVQVERDVFCAGYRERILSRTGENIFSGNSRPVKLEGSVRRIGQLPDDIPIGKNCVIQFVNSYDINTPFGNRHEERTYYTQNFLVVSSDSKKSESDTGGTPDLFDSDGDVPPNGNSQPVENSESREKQQSGETSPKTSNTNNTTPQTKTPPAEPVLPPSCRVDVFDLLKLFCN